MAEVGLLPLARTALEVATAVMPPYRSRFSKHPFTQPQLLAVLCRMRYEDWTFRETEVRLREHRELRRVLKLQSVPDYTTRYRPGAPGSIRRWAKPPAAWEPWAVAAEPEWPWTPPDWRQARSARFLCGAGIITPGSQ